MRALAKFLRRLADRCDPPRPTTVNVYVASAKSPADLGREVEKALTAWARRQGRSNA